MTETDWVNARRLINLFTVITAVTPSLCWSLHHRSVRGARREQNVLRRKWPSRLNQWSPPSPGVSIYMCLCVWHMCLQAELENNKRPQSHCQRTLDDQSGNLPSARWKPPTHWWRHTNTDPQTHRHTHTYPDACTQTPPSDSCVWCAGVDSRSRRWLTSREVISQPLSESPERSDRHLSG